MSSTEPKPRAVEFFELSEGRYPAKDWLFGLKSREDRQRILRRLEKVQAGNWGDWKWLGDAVGELRLQFGPGYRVYFGEDGQHLLILLVGGDKATQSRDISTAKRHWAVYKARKRGSRP